MKLGAVHYNVTYIFFSFANHLGNIVVYIPQLQLQDLHKHQNSHCEKIIKERM